MSTNSARLRNLAAMMLIGDGVLAFTHPTRHNQLWQADVRGYRSAIRWFKRHPQITRAGAALQVGLGIWLGRSAHTAIPASGEEA